MEDKKNIINLNGIRFEYAAQKEGDNLQRITGYVCKWNETNANGWNIRPGAFDKSLAAFREQGLKPRLDYEHDFSAVIGGIDSLESDDKGLRIEAHLNTGVALVRDTVLPLMQGGDLNFFSSEFIADEAEWDEKTQGVIVSAATLVGVAVVSLPADAGAEAYLASYRPQPKEEKERVCAENHIINQNSEEMMKKDLKKKAAELKVKLNGIEGADEATKRDIVSQLESLLDLVTDETSDSTTDEINSKLEAIRDLVEAVAEKTAAEETAEENARKAAAVATNSYLDSKKAAHDFCEVIRNCQNRDSFREEWNKKLAINGITVDAGSEEGYLPAIVHGYIQDAWDRKNNWLNRLRLTGAKRYAARVNYTDQDNEDARAKGHTPGNTKTSQALTMAAKIFDTQFVYKLMSMSKKTIYDNDEALLRYITDELYDQYLYEVRRAVLIGDGRANNSPHKISSLEAVARAATDGYVTVGTYDSNSELIDQLVNGIANIKEGRGGLIAFMSATDLNALRRVVFSSTGTPQYNPVSFVADQLGVDEIITTDLLGSAETYRVIVMRPEAYALVGNPLDPSFVSWEDYKANEMNYRVEAPIGGGIEGPKSAYVMKA
jgi:HK97 family phage prohead protease/HK97 family phage major capsid protein